ncbi:MAG: sugar phosphate isomerase/epimerase [Gammaproteobacteria bacterium]|nr:sugar phosphate isomerase/epimerase [Gammaproteobacteria bacterium]
MKLSISNIAWDQHDDPEVLSGLRERGINGIEVAPTKVWPGWLDANPKRAAQYKEKLSAEGFKIPAMQAILFGRPELQLFDQHSHALFFEHIKKLADLAAALGTSVLVFGSPKNRVRGQLSNQEAMLRAADFFRDAAEICHERDCCLGMEHNPAEYGCDFVTNVADADELVQRVNHPGFQLHLDSAGIHMCGSNIGEVIRSTGNFAHFHISEPMLEPIAGGVVDHKNAADTLNDIGYTGWVSIEMKLVAEKKVLYQSIDKVVSCYVDR